MARNQAMAGLGMANYQEEFIPGVSYAAYSCIKSSAKTKLS
jgi:hypothetical protein